MRMSDLISRQEAIDLAHELIVPNEYKYDLYNQAINNYCVEIMQLPSAQPDNLMKLASDIADFMESVKSSNSDFLVGYLYALSAVSEIIDTMRGDTDEE